MKTIRNVFTIVIALMVIAVFVLAYHVEGVDVGALWCLFLPLVILRYFRAILLMGSKILNKKVYIVSDCRSNYEWINTEESYSMFFLRVKYLFRGYRVWNIPPIWMARIIYNITGKRTYKGTNVSFTRFVKGTGQVTYWTPYMN